MAIGNHNDLTHIVRTSDQWKNTYDKYELIPTGVLCVELVSSDVTKIKIGDGHNIFSKLPYIGDLDLSKYYTKLETDTRIKEILTQEKVVRIKGLIGSESDLPADARCGDIYFVRQLSSSDNKYIEYIYSPDNTWEPLGGIPVDIDLSEYAKTAYVDDKIEQVNERIDDIEQHGTHTHANKDILDLITAAFTAEEKDKLSTLYNYDDTELRELITQASHTHSNKDILDAISAPFTKEDRVKLDSLTPYDDSILKEKITALERLAHEHSNKRILDRTTASFTTEYERKMRWIRLYTGCTGMEEGIAGLVPAAQAGEEDYVLSGSGEWVPQTGGGGTYELPVASTSVLGGIKVGDGLEIDANGKLSVVGGGGGDSIAEGDGITITTDPQTGVKTISVNTGDHLSVDSQTGELNVTGVDYTAGKGIYIGAEYKNVEYIKNSGNYDQIIITDIIPNFSDKLEMDIKFGAATGNTTNDGFIGCTGVVDNNKRFHYGVWCYCTNSDSNIGFYNHFVWTQQNTGSNFINHPVGISYDGSGAQRLILTMQGTTASWGNTSISFSNEYMTEYDSKTFVDPQIGIAIFGYVNKENKYYFDCQNLTVYGVKLYDSNDTLLHNLVPVKKLSNNEGGLYDTVTQRFYGNSGNGSFITGPETTPMDDRIINAKIGNGLGFDTHNAIEVVTGNGLQINQDGELEIDPSIIPEVMEYSAGEAIEITEVTHGDEFQVLNQEYFFDTRGLTCGLNARIWTTVNDGDILAAMCIHNNGGNQVPLFVGVTEDSVKVSQNYDSTILGPNGSFDYRGKTWYFTADYALSGTNGQDTQGHIQTLPTTYSFNSTPSNFVPAAKDLIDLAVLLSDLEYPTISVKYNKGLTVNQDNELEVNIGTGLEFDQVTGAINVTGGSGGDTVEAGDGIAIDTDSQTGNKVISIDTGNGLQINQDGELEIDPSIIPEVMEYSAGEAITIRDVSSTLPTGYVEVDYIEGVGNYTVIDYIPNRKTKIVGTASQTQTSYDPVLFGNRTGSNGQQFVFWFNRYDSTQAKVGFVYGTNTWGTSSDCDNGKLISYTLGDQFTFLISLDDEFNINDSFVHNITENGAPASNLKLGIFALVNTPSDEIESSDQIFRGKIYEFKIYEDDELVVNLIPAISTSTNQGGFYDVINDIFYTSKTATSFGYDSSTIHSTGKVIDVKYNKGLNVNQSNELEVVLSDGLQFDSTASETLVADKLYLFNSRVTCQVHTDSPFTGFPPNRTYQKTTIEPALCCLWEVGGADLMWTGPLIVGLTETSVQYTTQDTSQTVNYQNTFTYLGKTWYTSGYPDFLNNADHEDKLGHLQYLGSYSTTADQIQAAKDLIDLANAHFVSNAGIQAKLGNGLSFDANGAIQADAQPLSPATDSTLGGVIVGEGLNINEDGVLDGVVYEAGRGIEFDEAVPEGQFKVRNLEYYFDNQVSCQIDGNYGPRTFTRVSQYEQCLAVIWPRTLSGQSWTNPLFVGLTENSVKLTSSADSNILGPSGSFTYKGYTWYYTCTYGLMNSSGVDLLGNLQTMTYTDSTDEVDGSKHLIDLAGLVLYEESIDVWNSGTGWLNGAYNDGQSDQFWTNWYYTYHSKPDEYLEVPAGAIKMRQIGISNENDSRFEGGGVDCFNSSHHHFATVGCVTDEWFDIPEGTVYLQFGVKWNELNNRTISSSDIKSVTIEFYYDTPRHDTINAKLGAGLEFNENNAIQVKLGDGLSIDEDGAIEVTGGGGGDSIAEGEGITITTDSQTGVKTIGVNAGAGLEIDPITNELFVNGQLPEGTIIKKLTYVGNGSGSSNVIKFTKKPVGILSINGSSGTNYISAIPASINSEYLHGVYGGVNNNGVSCSCKMSYNDTTNELTFTQAAGGNNDAGLIYNANGKTYTMQYLTKGHTGSGTSVNNEVSVVKTFSYTGTGTTINNIQFPETPDYILNISGPLGSVGDIITDPIDIQHPTTTSTYIFHWTQNGSGLTGRGFYSFNDSTNVLTLDAADYGGTLNYADNVYYVRYIVNEVISTAMPYDAGEAISIETIGGLQPTNYSNNDFVDSIVSMNAGSIVKAADNSSFTLTASGDDCYTRGSSGQANGSYPFNVKASTKYRFAWDSADPTVHGKVYTYENGLYDAMMHEIDQYDSSYLEFTTSSNTTFIQARFGVMYAGDSITYSNVRLYEVIEDEDQYDEISVKYNKGLSVNQNNELEVNLGTGLAFDPQTGAINVTGGGGGSGDTVAEGAGIEITTDQQTGNKVIAINPGAGLQVNQTTNELEVSSGVVTSIAPTQNTPGSITVTEGDGTATPVSVISQMGGATSSTAGTAGYVPAPASGDDDAYLRGDGTWDDSVVTEDDELTLVFVPDDYQPS